MIHDYDEILLLAYLENEATDEQRAQVEQWLAEDAELRRLIAAMQQDRLVLQSMPDLSVPEDLVTRAIADVDAGDRLEADDRGDHDRPATIGYLRPLAIAASLLVVAGVGLLFLSNYSSEHPTTQESDAYNLFSQSTPAPDMESADEAVDFDAESDRPTIAAPEGQTAFEESVAVLERQLDQLASNIPADVTALSLIVTTDDVEETHRQIVALASNDIKLGDDIAYLGAVAHRSRSGPEPSQDEAVAEPTPVESAAAPSPAPARAAGESDSVATEKLHEVADDISLELPAPAASAASPDLEADATPMTEVSESTDDRADAILEEDARLQPPAPAEPMIATQRAGGEGGEGGAGGGGGAGPGTFYRGAAGQDSGRSGFANLRSVDFDQSDSKVITLSVTRDQLPALLESLEAGGTITYRSLPLASSGSTELSRLAQIAVADESRSGERTRREVTKGKNNFELRDGRLDRAATDTDRSEPEISKDQQIIWLTIEIRKQSPAADQSEDREADKE